MLSRTASQLFWLSRYMERAENTARVLDVMHDISLLPAQQTLLGWQAPLSITGTLESYLAQDDAAENMNAVIQYLGFSEENHASIVVSLREARSNAHAVRGTITPEMWESINSSWIELHQIAPSTQQGQAIKTWLDWVKQASHRFRGASYGTMSRGEAFQFLRLGTFLERADCTARILDVKYHILFNSLNAIGSAEDYYQWGALLRSVSAFENYQKLYHDGIRPSHIAEMLILNGDMPRSLQSCLQELVAILDKLPPERARFIRQLSENMHTKLRYTTIEDILAQGLHEFLTAFLSSISELSQLIDDAYFTHH